MSTDVPETLPSTPADWRQLAEAASKETDSVKMMQLIDQLCGALDKKDERKKDVA